MTRNPNRFPDPAGDRTPSGKEGPGPHGRPARTRERPSRTRIATLVGAALVLAAALAVAALALRDAGARPDAGAPGTAGSGTTRPAASDTTLPSHASFTSLLEQVVRMPDVDYASLLERREELDGYLDRLAATSPAALDAASPDEALAFWINAYNACMLRIVAENYPIEPGGTGLFGAIRNRAAGYPDDSVWQIRDVFTREHCRVAGAERSQDEIEHEIIRPGFEEPRIHFAVNCAAVSCPVLWPEAYVPEELDAQLDRAVRHLVADPEHFRLERGSPATLRLNRVLDWYSEDFGGTEGLKRFFAEYLEGDEREIVLREDTRVEFFEYDWALNDGSR